MAKHALILKTAIITICFGAAAATVQAQNSLYRDDRARGVGDIITVVLKENISGSTSADAKNSSDAEAGAAGSATGNFMPFQPTFGSDVEVNYASGKQAETNQGQLLEGYMSVEVVEKTTGGNLKVEGSRSTEINGEKHKINLTGIVRPKDINGKNQVLSYRVGNATINYEKEGGVRGVMKKEGFIKRAALAGVGLAVGAVAIMKAMN